MSRSCLLLLSFTVFIAACGGSDPEADGGLSLDAAASDGAAPDAVQRDGGLDAPAPDPDGGPAARCEGAPDGTECGERRECSAGECAFTDPPTDCDYDFTETPEDAFLVITCDHDLGGEEVQLPGSATLAYDGGSIRNGRLRLNGARIDGALLNPTLELGLRSGGAILDPYFVFDKERWEMVEGEATDEVAIRNRANMRMALDQVGDLGGETFVVGALDVFLDVADGPYHLRFLALPSDFHFQMSDATHLRVQPNENWEYSILTMQETSNVRISGGHLWGDRYTHRYIEGSRHDQGLGMYVLGAVDVIIENVTANQFTGDGLVVGVSTRRNDDGTPKDDHQYAANVIVRDCTFDENRRNGLALIDVEGIVLERLRVTNTALGDSDVDGPSAGTSPRVGIQIEPFQPAVSEGSDELRILEEVTDVVVRDSIFEGNYGADLNFFKCHRAEAYNNTFGSSLVTIAAFEVHVHDNDFVADGERARAINIAPRIRQDGSHFVRDWIVEDNNISGYENGIAIGGENQRIESNVIATTGTGILLLEGVNVRFIDNELTSLASGSIGYRNFRSGARRTPVSGYIEGGTVSAGAAPLQFNQIQGPSAADPFVVRDVVFESTSESPASVVASDNVNVVGCTADGFVGDERNNDIDLSGNTER